MSLPHTHVEPADAFILAGGRSSRMGQDKSLVTLNGMPLIQHAIAIFRSAGLKPCIAGARSDLSAFAPVIADDPAHPGPRPTFRHLLGAQCRLRSLRGLPARRISRSCRQR